MTKGKHAIIENDRTNLFGWQCFIVLLYTTISIAILEGCAVTSKKVFIKDLSRSFGKGSIIYSQTGKSVSFEELMADLNNVNVVYVGERHNNPAHHKIQLQVIKELFYAHQNITVGMEMFDHTYQNVLDQWSSGKLDQKAFLEKVHWYANWKFDFKLYSEILDFIKAKKIRLVGLNIPSHIPARISIGGIESLSDDDRKHLPKEINTSNTAHRAYVKEVFKQHDIMGRKNFEYFYTAQCIWEETMAESITKNIENNIMIVLVGNGHIQQKFGIPDRVFRRTQTPSRTIFPASVGSRAELSFADYIWITQ